MTKTPVGETVEYQHAGRTFTGTFLVDATVINLSCPYGMNSTQLGSTSPRIVARMLLGELVSDAATKGDL